MVEFTPHDEVGNGGGEIVDKLVELASKCEMGNRRRERIYLLIKAVAKSEMCQ